jgi:hypothetical protein
MATAMAQEGVMARDAVPPLLNSDTRVSLAIANSFSTTEYITAAKWKTRSINSLTKIFKQVRVTKFFPQ